MGRASNRKRNKEPRLPTGEIIYTRGDQARRAVDEKGRRKFVPFKVTLEMQMSELSVSSTQLVIYLYQEEAAAASEIAYRNCLNKWYKRDKGLLDTDWPKPAGMGSTHAVTDREFTYTWRQALKEGKDLRRAGDLEDPVAFHVIEERKIILSA